MHLSLQNGVTALMKSSAAGQVECIKVLLDRRAEVNMQNKVTSVTIMIEMWNHCVLLHRSIPIAIPDEYM